MGEDAQPLLPNFVKPMSRLRPPPKQVIEIATLYNSYGIGMETDFNVNDPPTKPFSANLTHALKTSNRLIFKIRFKRLHGE